MEINHNIRLVMKSITKAQEKLDIGARLARDEMMARLIQLSQREIKGDRKNVGYPATPGKPPMNVTGNLRRSIRGQKIRTGFASYSAIVGPTIIYGRSVEMGNPYNPPTWQNGQRFPYMKTAFEKYRRKHVAIMRKYLSF